MRYTKFWGKYVLVQYSKNREEQIEVKKVWFFNILNAVEMNPFLRGCFWKELRGTCDFIGGIREYKKQYLLPTNLWRKKIPNSHDLRNRHFFTPFRKILLDHGGRTVAQIILRMGQNNKNREKFLAKASIYSNIILYVKFEWKPTLESYLQLVWSEGVKKYSHTRIVHFKSGFNLL